MYDTVLLGTMVVVPVVGCVITITGETVVVVVVVAVVVELAAQRPTFYSHAREPHAQQ